MCHFASEAYSLAEGGHYSSGEGSSWGVNAPFLGCSDCCLSVCWLVSAINRTQLRVTQEEFQVSDHLDRCVGLSLEKCLFVN